jgi:hypothetical protein
MVVWVFRRLPMASDVSTTMAGVLHKEKRVSTKMDFVELRRPQKTTVRTNPPPASTMMDALDTPASGGNIPTLPSVRNENVGRRPGK